MFLQTIFILFTMIFINAIIVLVLTTLAASFPFSERGRRDPGSRAMTWSRMPGGGMSVFASSADDMWSQSGLTPPMSTWQDQGYNWRNVHEPEERKLFQEEVDTSTMKPFEDDDNFKLPRRPFDDARDRRRSSKPKKYDDEDDDRRYSGSNANASFNAWFPIMLGMYPTETGKSSKSHNYGEQDDGRSLAAIANSVNHGRSGVASSHAVVYTGQPQYNQHKSHRI